MKNQKMWMKYLAIALMLLTVALRSDVREISAVSDVAGISVDPGENGNYLFGLEIAAPAKGDGFTVGSKLMQVQAKTLSDALERAGLRGEYPTVLTHGSLVVIHADLAGSDLNQISEMLLEEWKGQMRTYMAVADGCDAADILRQDERENLRAGLLSAQLRRADQNGQVDTEQAFALCSRVLNGETVSLPLVALDEEGYRISGNIQVGENDETIC